MRRRSRLVKLTVLPALATACATAPIRDDDAEQIDRGMRSELYSSDTPGAEGIAIEEDGTEQTPPPLVDSTGTYWGTGGSGFGGGGFRVSRGGFGHFFSGHSCSVGG